MLRLHLSADSGGRLADRMEHSSPEHRSSPAQSVGRNGLFANPDPARTMKTPPNRLSQVALVSAALAAMGSTPVPLVLSPNNISSRFRNGPCRVCGKPNVRRGREQGIYLCAKCYKTNPPDHE